jgi:hypothetical protein
VHRIRRSHGAAFAERPAVPVSTAELTGRSWSWLVTPRLPAVRLRRDPVPLAVHARATADFRDEYYALVGRVREAADETTPPLGATVGRLVTTGLVDPGRIAWGERGARFARARYAAPVVDLSAPPAALAAWAARRGVPKVLLATQTRVLEPAVDDDGRYLPVPPLIVLEPLAAERLWHVAAALAAPPLSVLALREHAGGALSADAIKLAAREALQLPAPTDPAAWDDAAGAFRLVTQAADVGEWRAALDRFAPIACAAYEITGAEQADVLDWWRARRPDRDGCTGARNDRQFARHRSQR